jgi:hypothetical protein
MPYRSNRRPPDNAERTRTRVCDLREYGRMRPGDQGPDIRHAPPTN